MNIIIGEYRRPNADEVLPSLSLPLSGSLFHARHVQTDHLTLQ